jgi:hypothetical protein
VLHAAYTGLYSYFDDWLDAFNSSENFDNISINVLDRDAKAQVARELPNTELVILLHSILGDGTNYLEPLIPLLRDRRCILLAFVGNEVNLPGTRIANKRRVLTEIEPDLVATQLPIDAGEFLFGDVARLRVIAITHALNPLSFSPPSTGVARKIDIGVRAARYLPHLGDDDRNRIHDYFEGNAQRYGLRVDVSDQRLDRASWAAFLMHSKGTVSTEAGSWYIERDDRTVEAIRAWANVRASARYVVGDHSMLNAVYNKLPALMKSLVRQLKNAGIIQHEITAAQELSFAEVYQHFFSEYKLPDVYGKCISSRHFDAIGTKTCQIMFRGRFNDILVADEHYIALEQDFSNIDDVLMRFSDETYIARMVDRAYELVMSNHTYHHRLAEIYRELENVCR